MLDFSRTFKMKKYKTLESFFLVNASKTGQNENSVSSNEELACKIPVSSEFVTPSCSSIKKIPEDFPLTVEENKTGIFVNDISLFVSSKTKSLSDIEKVEALRNIWAPSSNYTFPETKLGNKRRRFQISWLEKFHWLAYSRAQNGAYCKFCVLFASNDFLSGKGGHQLLGGLVTKPYQNLKDALEYFRAHEQKDYHKNAVLKGENICNIVDGKRDPIIIQLDSKRKQDALNNRRKLIPIIETLLLCGRQQIALRGHEDSGRIPLVEPKYNDGNFRALLRYRAKNDAELKEHLTSSSSNAMYMSPRIQNELLDIMAHIVQAKILQRVKDAGFFSVLADETTEIAQIEQFSLCVRYFNERKMQLREDFLTFVEVSELTGTAFAETIKTTLTKLGLDLSNLRGQGYDRAAAMRGQFRGVQAVITETYPKAIYTHCMSDSLNLCLNDSSTVQTVRNAFGIVSEVCSFFRTSARRTALLKEKIKEMNPGKHAKKLKTLCPTRWVERHDSLLVFKDHLIPTIYSLEYLQEISPYFESGKAQSLLRAVCAFPFIITICICSRILGMTHSLSESLQNKQIDLISAIKMIKLVLEKLKSIRETAEESFNKIFREAECIAGQINVEPAIPRLCKGQRNRENVPAMNAEDYFRRTVFLPYLDDMISSMNERFLTHEEKITSLQYFIPSLIVGRSFHDVKSAFDFYKEDVSNFCTIDTLKGEWELWQMKWEKTNIKERPQDVLEALENCEKAFYPSIFLLLKILAVLPVTTATVERTFSTLRKLKTYLRNTTGETRLTSLALLAIHRDIELSTEEIINEFKNVADRRLDFTF